MKHYKHDEMCKIVGIKYIVLCVALALTSFPST